MPRGQSLVEFALVLPILLLLIGGAVDLGRLFYAQIAISNAAKEGVFFGATSPGCDVSGSGCTDPRNVSWHVAQETVGLSAVSHSTSCVHGEATVTLASCQEDDVLQVRVDYTFSLATPILSGIFGGTIPLHATANAVVLNQSFDPSATPVPGSSTTPSPTPSPSAGTCVVPDFIGTRAHNADDTWSAAGFTGGVTQSGSGNFTINSQSLSAGSTQACVSSITVSSSAPTSTPAPTATPTPTPTPSASSSPTPTPTPTPTASPTPSCRIVPNLVGLKVSAARSAWTAAGFTGSFSPSNGQNNKTVTNQVTNPSSAPGQCIAATASVTVTYS